MTRTLTVAICLGFLAGSAAAAPPADPAPYARTLRAYVDGEGLVAYADLQTHREDLETYLRALAAVPPANLAAASESERIAFWINAYNALTLKAILDHYPIHASFLKSFIYPRNSIRQIPGVWDKLRFPVAGRDRTLNEIEHAILRRRFREPRIHMALVCAARGCPPLRREPYRGEALDRQLDDQARRFLADPHKFRIDRHRRRVYLSPIFKWFGRDFTPAYVPAEDQWPDFSPEQRAVLNFVLRYLNPEDRDALLNGDFSLRFLDYDWSLNERPSDHDR